MGGSAPGGIAGCLARLGLGSPLPDMEWKFPEGSSVVARDQLIRQNQDVRLARRGKDFAVLTLRDKCHVGLYRPPAPLGRRRRLMAIR